MSQADKMESAVAHLREEVRDLHSYHLDRHDVAVKLDQNEVSFACPEPIREAIEEAFRTLDIHRYPDIHPRKLQQALAELNDWPEEGILVGNGSNEILLMLALAMLGKNRKVLVPTPSFSSYSYVSRLAGAEVVEISPDSDLLHPVHHYLDAIDRTRPTVVFLCSPNNPTGAETSLEDIETVAEHCPGLLAVDEAYFDFAGASARGLLANYPNLVLLRTFSKAAGLAGLRVGYLLAHPDLAVEIQKTQMPFAVNPFSRAAALAACRHYDLIRARAREIVKQRDSLFERLVEMNGVRPYPSSANFILFDCTAKATSIFEGLLARGVLVRDLSSHPRLPRALRVTVGRADENERFVSALKETLEDSR